MFKPFEASCGHCFPFSSRSFTLVEWLQMSGGRVEKSKSPRLKAHIACHTGSSEIFSRVSFIVIIIKRLVLKVKRESQFQLEWCSYLSFIFIFLTLNHIFLLVLYCTTMLTCPLFLFDSGLDTHIIYLNERIGTRIGSRIGTGIGRTTSYQTRRIAEREFSQISNINYI